MTRLFGAVLRAKSERSFGERLRTHVVGRRVDQISPQRDGGCDTLDARAVNLFGRAKTRRFALGRLVAREGIGRQKKRQRRLSRRLDAIAKTIKAHRQRSRELSGKKRIARLRLLSLGAEENARRAAAVRRKECGAGFRLKSHELGKADCRFGKLCATLGPVFLSDEIDGDRLRRPVFKLHPRPPLPLRQVEPRRVDRPLLFCRRDPQNP